jgi:hypothetical protein
LAVGLGIGFGLSDLDELTFDLDVSRFETCLAVEEVMVVLAYYRDDRYSGYASAGVLSNETYIEQRGRKHPS